MEGCAEVLGEGRRLVYVEQCRMLVLAAWVMDDVEAVVWSVTNSHLARVACKRC